VITPCVFARLIYRNPETRNFKKRERGIAISCFTNVSVNPSLTRQQKTNFFSGLFLTGQRQVRG
jgi:alkyl sulfatase BDS1-like metallo-beta-lactamase superfamily hydrolase